MLPQRTRIETAVQLALQGATVLTFNTRAARRLHLECALNRQAQSVAWETPDILPAGVWIERTWSECLLAGLTNRPLLSAIQTQRIWERVVSDSSYGRNLLNGRGAAASASSAWNLVHGYGVRLLRGAFGATEESRAFFEWTREYGAVCEGERWADLALALNVIAAELPQIPGLPNRIAVFGFDNFTPQQQHLWTALQQRGIEVTVLQPELADLQGEAHTVCLEDTEAELHAAARWTRALLQSNSRARIGIVAPDLGAIRPMAERIFEEVLHPEQFILPAQDAGRSFDLSLGLPIAEYAIIRSALLVMKLCFDELSPEELTTLLHSSYLGSSTRELFARARLDRELREKVRGGVTLQPLLEALDTCGARVPALRSILRDIKKEAGKTPSRLNRSQWLYHTRRILNDARWPGDGESGRKRNSTEFQACEAWDSLLQAFAALDVIAGPESPAALLLELERLALDRTFAPKNEAAPVQILGALEASGDSFDAMWVCGLTDEAWPATAAVNPCIPLALQREAGIPAADPQSSLEATALTTARLRQSAAECILSWPKREEDRELRASPLVRGIPARSAEEESAASRWTEFPASESETMVDETAPAVLATDLQVHGTRLLEWQSNCPFQAFAQARLSAESARPLRVGLDPRQRGKLVELMLQKIWEDLRTSAQLTQPQLTAADLEGTLQKGVDFAMEREYPLPDEDWERSYRSLERERLLRLAREWLELEKKREPFVVHTHQQEVNFEIGGIPVHGWIDRIDRTLRGDYVVIDYKTGRGPYSIRQWDVPRPSRPQLPLYVVSQMEQGREIAGVAYAHLGTGQCCFKGDGRGKQVFGNYRDRAGDEFQERISKWKPELEKIAVEFLSGHAEVDPKEPPGSGGSPCRNCGLGELCRIAEMRLPEPECEENGDE